MKDPTLSVFFCYPDSIKNKTRQQHNSNTSKTTKKQSWNDYYYAKIDCYAHTRVSHLRLNFSIRKLYFTHKYVLCVFSHRSTSTYQSKKSIEHCISSIGSKHGTQKESSRKENEKQNAKKKQAKREKERWREANTMNNWITRITVAAIDYPPLVIQFIQIIFLHFSLL